MGGWHSPYVPSGKVEGIHHEFSEDLDGQPTHVCLCTNDNEYGFLLQIYLRDKCSVLLQPCHNLQRDNESSPALQRAFKDLMRECA
jgi:hypothetical protein